ncbi:hypothetical protein GCM10017691_01010 [Pseudonocardia petroleophila]|uniref:Uncharacterized protein n=1 Tax=Pseudonocardia petroleophila TaxID=37331 RepID=A0A7G7MLD9_9PSEU|nr:hypothetical protein [Pseudonocardia petroleophila]QNG53600.1 hypothetical protein H6H00_06490 [Pseudonocardia petroleophila]
MRGPRGRDDPAAARTGACTEIHRPGELTSTVVWLRAEWPAVLDGLTDADLDAPAGGTGQLRAAGQGAT